MDLGAVLAVLHGWLYLVVIFGISLSYAMFRGRQALINLIMGLYIALLLQEIFPFRESLLDQAHGAQAEAVVSLSIFTALTVLSAWLFSRLMPREYLEGAFESLGRKMILALLFTALFMVIGNHYLPLDSLISTGNPLPAYLQTENLSFWWLALPLVVLFFL